MENRNLKLRMRKEQTNSKYLLPSYTFSEFRLHVATLEKGTRSDGLTHTNLTFPQPLHNQIERKTLLLTHKRHKICDQ